MSLCDRNCVILRTNRARCTLYKKIFDLLDEESVSGVRSGRASLQEVLLGESITKVRFKYLFWSTNNISECGSTLYVGLACTASPTNTNFWLTLLLTRLLEALYEDLSV